MADLSHAHPHSHAPAPRRGGSRRSFARQGLMLRLALAGGLVALIWLAIWLLVRG